MEHPDFYTLEDRKPLNRSTSNLTGVIMSGISPDMQILVFLSPRGGGCTHTWNCHLPCLFFTPRYFFIPCAPVEIAPFDGFSCFMAQMTCFGDSYVIFGVRIKILIIFTIFRKTTQNSPFPQCRHNFDLKLTEIKRLQCSATDLGIFW